MGYDVILIATSSYGEGDPPDNIASLMLRLLKAKIASETPLEGLQHAVLGFGSSVYETYQNTPRLMDKLLEECGSRRMAKRAELDEGSEEDPEVETKRFEKEIYELLQSLPSASSKPACSWKEPADTILEKSESDLNILASDDAARGMMPLVLGGIAVVGAAVAYQMGYMDG